MNDATTQRLFLALWPDAATRDAITAWQARWEWPRHAAVVKAHRLHITLHFLGDVPSPAVPALRETLAVPFETFTLGLGQPQLWGQGIAVVRPLSMPPELNALHERLAQALTRSGLAVESRPYKPHVTLARRAAGATPPAVPLQVRWDAAGGYALVRSMPGTAQYETVARFPA